MGNETETRSDAEASADKQRELQRQQDAKDRQKSSKPESPPSGAVQAGARRQPEKMPAQHLEKPGREADLQLAPHFMAPDYKGSGKLQDMVALITGGDSGIGRAVAVLFAREGADVAIVYLESSTTTRRRRSAASKPRAGAACCIARRREGRGVLPRGGRERRVREFGRLDVLVNNAAFQEHADSLEDITDERFDETLRTNVLRLLPHGPGRRCRT